MRPGRSPSTRENDDEAIILTENGRPLIALLPLGDIDLETVVVSLSPKSQAIMERARHRRRTEGGISHEEILRQFGLDPPPNDEPTH